MEYHLCKSVSAVSVAGQCDAPPCGAVAILACTEWQSADSMIVAAPPLPSLGAGAELYSWGFAAVLIPVLILWMAVVVVRGIRVIAKGSL